MILQDDALCCQGFARAVERAVELLPDRLVSFFLASHAKVEGLRLCEADRLGQPFVELTQFRWVPLVALMYPPGLAADFHGWAAERKVPLNHLADDSVAASWVRARSMSFFCTVPSLVDHPDDTPTLVSANRGRTAHCYIGSAPIEDWLALT